MAELRSAQDDFVSIPLAEQNKIKKLMPGKNRIDDLIGHFSYAEFPEDLEAPPIKCSPEQRSYCSLRVRGFSKDAACKKLRLNRTTCTRWETQEWFEVICEEERRDWLVGAGIDEKQEILVPLVPDTIKAIKDTLHSEDEKIRLSAAQFVLDNIFGQEKKSVGRPKKDSEESLPDLSDIMSAARDKINFSRERTVDERSETIVSSEQMTAKFEEEYAIRMKTGNLPQEFLNGRS
jgi:hypothetical protein